jgi:microcystin degradation protein MlrC
MAEFIERKVYWQTTLGGEKRVWIGDPTEAQYLQTTPAHLLEIAARLVAAQGLLRIEGEWAEATPGLMGQAERFENTRRQAVEELEKKHAFERG